MYLPHITKNRLNLNLSIQDLSKVKQLSMEFIAVLDSSGKVLRTNENWTTLFDSSKLTPQTPFSELVLEEDRSVFLYLFSNLTPEQSVSQSSIKFVGINSEIISMHLQLSKVEDEVFVQGINITERNNERFSLQTISKISSTGAWCHNPLTGRTFWSSECYAVYNLKSGVRITEDLFYSFFLSPYKESLEECVRALYEEQKKYTHYGKIETQDGQVKWIRTVAEPTIHEGKIIRVCGISSDVTERQEMIEKLKENERNKTLALKGIKSALFYFDVLNDQITAGDSFREIFGPQEPHKLTYDDFLNLVHEEDRPDAKAKFLTQLETGEGHYFNQYRMLQQNGSVQHYEVYAWKETDEQGKVKQLVGNLINVEERVQAEKQLKSKIDQLEAVINNGFNYMMLLDPEGYIIHLDTTSRKLTKEEFGLDPEEERVKFKDVIPHSFIERFDVNFEKARNGETVSGFFDRPLTSGQTLFGHRTFKPIFNEKGKLDSVLVVLVDLTQTKKAELAEAEARILSEKLIQLKRNLLSNMSHELLTPINGILGINTLLEMELKGQDVNHLLKSQKESTLRLLSTVNNLLELNKIKADKGPLDIEKAELSGLISEVTAKYAHMAKAKGIELIFKLDSSEIYIRTDKSLFEVAVGNIVNNALKYTNEGFVRITAKTEGEHALIEVADSGIGIEDTDAIFEPFVQESGGMARKYEGSGIGLSLSKKYIENMNGRLEVESQKDEGSIFKIRFPLERKEG